MENISPETLKNILQSEDLFIIDVREPDEYNFEHIKNAENIPLSQLDTQLLGQNKYKDKKIILYCRSGKRSLDGCEKIKDLEPENKILNLEGGIIAWKKSGFEITSSGRKIPPINQQMQIAIGAIVIITGPILFFLKMPYWYVLQILLGVALINAGITGNCRLAKAIQTMPWNKN